MTEIFKKVGNLWQVHSTKIILLLFALMIIIGIFMFINQRPKNKEGPSGKFVISSALNVDSTEDARALGYTGQKKVVKNSKGDIFVGYRKKFNGFYEAVVAKVAKGRDGSWNVSNTDKPISQVGNQSNQRVPSIAIDNKDVIHVVWYGADSEKDENNRQVKYSNSKDFGETWSPWINLSVVDGFDGENLWQEHPDILTTKDGKLYVVWEGKDSENKNQQIKLSVSSDGGNSWSKWVNINPTTNASHSRPTIIEDTSGRLHIFMYSSRSTNVQQIWHSFSDNGTVWSEWTNISRNYLDSRHISVAAGKDNKIYVAWRSGNEREKTSIHYSMFNGENWSQPLLIHESSSYQFFPEIGVDKSGNIFVTWMESMQASDFPNENPQKSQAVVAIIKSTNSSPIEVASIQEANVLYPHLLKNSQNQNNTELIYSAGEAPYLIRLTNIEIR